MGLLALIAFSSLKANSQDLHSGTLLQDNSEISVEGFEWMPAKDKDTPGVDVRFILRNKTSRPIYTTRFSVTAQGKNGVMIEDKGSVLKRLTSRDTIAPNAVRSLYFPRAYTFAPVDNIQLKEVYVEFANGSLSILKD